MHPSPLLPHVSASQIEKYLRCPRQWWLRYKLDEKEPETEAQRVGKAMHAELETWWQEGIKPTNPLALAALKVLPPRDPSLLSWSVEWSLPPDWTLAGTPIKGFIDLLLVDHSEGVPNATVLDYKTTAGWEWAKSADELRSNVQILLYAWAALRLHPAVEVVTVGHVAVHKKQRAARLTTVELSRPHVFERIDRLCDVVQRMQRDWLRSEPPPALAPVPACEAFGGCPHRGTCFPHNSALVRSIQASVALNNHRDPMTQATSPTDRLKALIASRNAPKPPGDAPLILTASTTQVPAQAPSRKACSWVPADAQADLEPRPLDVRPLTELATWPKAASAGAEARGIRTVSDLLTFLACGGDLQDIKGMGAKAAPKVQGELDRVAPLWPADALALRRACDRFVVNNVEHPAAQAAQALRRVL